MFSIRLSEAEKEKRKNIFLSLPADLREYIISSQTADKLYNIVWNKYKLGDDYQIIISFTMGEIMLGLIKLNDFAITLKNRTELDDKIIQGISQDINQSIFQPIMNILPKTSKSFTDNDNVVDLKKTFK